MSFYLTSMNFKTTNLSGRKMNKRIAIKEIIDFLGSDVIKVFGDIENVYVKHLNPPELVDEDTLDWIGKLRQNK